MSIFALLLIGIALYLNDIQILWKGSNVEQYIFSILIITIGFIQLNDIGFSKVFNRNFIDKLNNTQRLTLIVVVSTSILAILKILGIAVSFGFFASGLIVTQAILILFDAWLGEF